MSNNTELETEVALQWIKGDKIGNVEIVKNKDNEWTTFKSGTRIASNLINEFMIPLEGEPLDFNYQQPIPNNTLDKNGLGSPPISETGKLNTDKKVDNPIKTLFNKQKKTDSVSLTLTFSVNVPTKDIFDIISMTFDEDEVLTELNSFISNQIEENVLKDTLKTSIEDLIQNKFKVNS
jgi:hypothetical protein